MKNFKFTLLFLYMFTLAMSNVMAGKDLSLHKDSISVDFVRMLNAWAGSFITKIPDDYADTLNFHLKDDDSHYHIIFADGKYTFNNWKNPSAGMVITSELEVYKKIYSGELNAMTAVGRASIYDPAPLDFTLENGMTMGQINWNRAYFNLINFFNVDPNNKTILSREHARKIHGAHAVALFYTTGYRSAYYSIMKGETLNESGEKDPFNQSFIIISGSGYAKIGEETFEIKANEAYYIKPDIEHKVWTDSEEGVTLIWNAWGSEAW